MSGNNKLLPPMPKLRPRPGLTIMPGEASSKKRKIEASLPEIIEEDAKTSRLLTKSECGRGGGRKRSSGSLIHSIPKFSQVLPKGGQISEVQKVLQSRLLSKQLSKQMPPSTSSKTSKVEDLPRNPSSEYHASSMLQSIVSLHEKTQKIQTPKPLPMITMKTAHSTGRRRGRKPDKSSICHVVPEPEVIIQEDSDSTDLKRILDQQLDHLNPEVTITPSLKKPKDVLQPEEYRALGMPRGFIYLPAANVFMHPSRIQQQQQQLQEPESQQSLSSVMKLVKPQGLSSDSAKDTKTSKNNSEVSICKFKFTGGAKPTLEEKKMMSVDSGGNFRYYSGESSDPSRSLKAVETLSKEIMATHASHIITDRFTSLTAEKLSKKILLNSAHKEQPSSSIDLDVSHKYRPIKPKPNKDN